MDEEKKISGAQLFALFYEESEKIGVELTYWSQLDDIA